MRSLVRIAAGVVTLGILGMPTAAFAQMGQRSYQGLFGGSGYDPKVRHSLEFNMAVTEAYDDDAPGQFVGNVNDFLVSGFSTVLEGNGQYKWRNNRVELGASGTSVLRYYNEFDNFRSATHSGAFGFSAKLTPTSDFFANQSVSYSPSYFYQLFPTDPNLDPGETPPAGEDYQVVDSVSMYYNTDLRWSQRIGARNTFGVTGNFNYTDFMDDEPVAGQTVFDDLRSYTLRADYTRNFNRRLGLIAAYFYRQGDYAYSTGPETKEHGVEGGLDYNRALSATRGAFVGFRVAVSTVDGTGLVTPEGFDSGSVTLVSGSVNLGYQFGRSWSVTGHYRRGVDYVAGFVQPVLSDGVSVNLAGSLTSRLEFLTSFGYSNGDSALFDQTFPFDTYTGQSSLRYALTKSIACSFEYLYYYYRFAEATPPGVPQGLERNGVRAGLTVWVPAFRR
jgi:hypothetical protein